MKVKINDQVAVIAGKDKGKSGKVVSTMSKHSKVVVEKINLKTKHIKKTQQRAGEKIQFEAPVHVSNVMLICPKCNKRTRVEYKKLDNGKKERTCKKCKEIIDVKVTAKK
ncbi:50S ribosomal protein L24 [Candidatus Peregrinibacteria bacterium]|nr:50S ribosomal protein L24 [Candidatus Peregrinibacteria bacterium]